jgi:hypothetical protein
MALRSGLGFPLRVQQYVFGRLELFTAQRLLFLITRWPRPGQKFMVRRSGQGFPELRELFSSTIHPSKNDACCTKRKPHKLKLDEPDYPVVHTASCLKAFDDGHPTYKRGPVMTGWRQFPLSTYLFTNAQA